MGLRTEDLVKKVGNERHEFLNLFLVKRIPVDSFIVKEKESTYIRDPQENLNVRVRKEGEEGCGHWSQLLFSV